MSSHSIPFDLFSSFLSLLPFFPLSLLPSISHSFPLSLLSSLLPSSNPLSPHKYRPKFILVRIGAREFSRTESPSNVLEDVQFTVEYLRKKGYQASAEAKGENLCSESQSLDPPTNSIYSAQKPPVKIEIKENKKNWFSFWSPLPASVPTPATGDSANTNTHAHVPLPGSYMCVWGTRINEFELVKPGI